MKKTFAALTATLTLAIAAPAIAKDEAPRTFSFDGVTYSYTVTKAGKSTIYEGYARPGQKFRFVKNGKQVVGTANGIPVTFRMDEVAKTVTSIQVASR